MKNMGIEPKKEKIGTVLIFISLRKREPSPISYEFYKAKYPNEKKFYDLISPLLEKKYLKTIYNCHECTQTIDKGDTDGDGEISVLDIDFILH